MARRAIDITGQKFGRLLVIKRSNRVGKLNGSAYWVCKCDCGTELITTGQALRRGLTKSCGCIFREVTVKDIAGQKFGRVTVIERDYGTTRTNRGAMWKCECDCGQKFTTCGYSLRSGRTQSCGCLAKELRFVDLKGHKYGSLTIVEHDLEASQFKHRAMWKCRCDCGKEITLSANALQSGNTTSCGCRLGKKHSRIVVGQKFGSLTIVELDEEMSKRMRRSMWKCRCDCGTEATIHDSSLKLGLTRSCGCYRKGHTGRKKKAIV